MARHETLDEGRWTRRVNGRVLAVSLVMALTGLGDALLYVVLPLHATALGLSNLQVGVLLSGNRFVRMVTNSGAAWLLRRLPPRLPYVGATALAALSTALYGVSAAFLPFLAARLLWGLTFSTTRLGGFLTVLGVAAETSRGRLLGVYRAIWRAGALAATVAGGILFEAYGFRTTMLLLAFVSLLALPFALWGSPQQAESRAEVAVAPSELRPWWSRFRLPRLGQTAASGRLLAVNYSAFALAFVVRGVLIATLALYLRDAFGDHFGPGGGFGVAAVAAWLVGLRWAAEIGLAAPLGALSDRLGRMRSAVGWAITAGVAILGLALAPMVALAVVAAAVLFVAASGLGATLDAAAGDLALPGERARVITVYADWSDLGAAFGPLLALTLADVLGLRLLYAVCAAVLAGGAALLYFSNRAAPLLGGGAVERDKVQPGV